jgi:hypothetical protein
MAICLEYQAVYYDQARIRRAWWATLCASLLLLFMLGLKVWIKIESTSVGYDLAAQRARAVQIDMQRRELELQLSVLMRSDELGRRAHERLGLGALDSKQARKIVYGG